MPSNMYIVGSTENRCNWSVNKCIGYITGKKTRQGTKDVEVSKRKNSLQLGLPVHAEGFQLSRFVVTAWIEGKLMVKVAFQFHPLRNKGGY